MIQLLCCLNELVVFLTVVASVCLLYQTIRLKHREEEAVTAQHLRQMSPGVYQEEHCK